MKKKILLVDDESGFTKMVKLNLESTGKYTVIEENDGQKALSAAHRNRPDFVFLDVVMPGIDGGEVAAAMRRDRVLRDVPIVFLTAIVSRSEAASTDSIGGFPFLSKPISLKEMTECIEAHIGP